MSSIILEAREIRYHYPRGMEAIRGISFHIRKGEKIALVGPNGAGKSTLMLMFNGMIRPDSGPSSLTTSRSAMISSRSGNYANEWVLSSRTRTGRLLHRRYTRMWHWPCQPRVQRERGQGRLLPGRSGTWDSRGSNAAPPISFRVERRNALRLQGCLRWTRTSSYLMNQPAVLIHQVQRTSWNSLMNSITRARPLLFQRMTLSSRTRGLTVQSSCLRAEILQEAIPDVAFGRPEYVRQAHLSMPILLDLYFELEKRGYSLPERKPRTVLDMLQVIDVAFQKTPCSHASPGTISVFDVDSSLLDSLPGWLASHPGVSNRCDRGPVRNSMRQKITSPLILPTV